MPDKVQSASPEARDPRSPLKPKKRDKSKEITKKEEKNRPPRDKKSLVRSEGGRQATKALFTKQTAA